MNLGKLQLSWAKSLEILLWLAALSVLVENVSLLRQNRSLQEAVAPQIAAGTQLQMLSGITLDGRIVPVGLPALGSKLLILTFSPGCPACQANQARWMSLASTLAEKGGVRVLWVSRDPIEITKEYCLKHGIPLADVLADPPYRTYARLGLCPCSEQGVGGRHRHGGESVGWAPGSGWLGHALRLFWRAAREGFSGPNCGWSHYHRVRE